ncbi:MAG: DUF4390 domain-containing protein [Desulfosarcinaceae bacterium]|nr:DUF4390 domain-containing protein [Desulfosarcinaceae bacterium]
MIPLYPLRQATAGISPRCGRLVLLLIGLLCIWSPVALHAQDAHLTNIIVTNSDTDLLIFLSVEGAFQGEINTAIDSGVPTSFYFLLHLYRTRNFWLDEQLADVTVTHTIQFDPLKKTYTVTRSWEDGKPITVATREEALRLMAEVDNLPILPLRRLKKGAQYQIRTKAELSKQTLPFYLHYVLFFVSWWDFETDWYTIDFIF